MKGIKSGGVWIMAGVLTLVLTGCAKPPVEEKNAAQAARDAAVAAQAETYAVKLLEEAKNLWDDAETKMQNKAYQEAKAAYIAAKATYEKAAGEIEAGKKIIADENQAALNLLEQSWKELDKLSVKKAAKLAVTAKQEWVTDSQAIQAAIKKAKDIATDPAEVKKALEAAKQLAEKWFLSFKK